MILIVLYIQSTQSTILIRVVSNSEAGRTMNYLHRKECRAGVVGRGLGSLL